MLKPLARTTAVLVAGLVAAASARAQVPSPPVVLPCRIPRADARQEAQVSLEVRVVTVPDQFFERIGVDFNVNTTTDKAPQPCPAQFHPAGFINDFTPDNFLSGLPHAGTCTRDLPTPVCQANTGPVFLNAKQVYEFLEGVQGDAHSNVMQAPKITLFNNQMGHVDCTDKQSFVTSLEVVQRDGRPVVVPKTEDIVTGFRMSACPKVSADGRFVRLKLEVNQTDPASSSVPLCPVTVLMQDTQGRNPVPFTQFLQQPKMNTTTIETNLVIPDGGTVLLGGGKKEVEVRSECGPPVLSRVPYINRLFKNVAIGREAQTVYVLVTPRILVNEEAPREHAARACGSPVAPTPVPSMPRELVNNPLPPYVIEPPDILLVESAPLKNDQQIPGQHLVRPDGTIGLGTYGSAFVGGKTIEQARETVAEQLRKHVSKFDISDLNVDVLAFNSKVYYVVTEVGGHGEQVYQFPITGSETVLDALAQIKDLPLVDNSKSKVWVARPSPDEAGHVLPVDWCGIVQRGNTSTNYQLMPGDRVYVNRVEEPQVSARTQCKGAPCCTQATKAEGAKEIGLHVVEGRVVEATAPISSWLIVPRDAEESEPVELTTRGKAKALEVELHQAEESKPVEAPSRSQAKVMRELLKAYDEACATGHTQEAAKLAQAALVLDPTCFAKRHGR